MLTSKKKQFLAELFFASNRVSLSYDEKLNLYTTRTL